MSENKAFKFELEIYYEDTDCGGVVYYANYLRFFERARTHLLKSMGFDPARLAREGVVFAVTRAEVDYKSPAVYGDRLVIETGIENVRSVRLFFTYKVITAEDGRLIATGRTDMACVNGKMRPQRIPKEILEKINEQTRTESEPE
ncbi:Tol-Pal system-associated acyl-CoA thioesterase [hydrothermal vent metagenome]|uniref:Tol-Pal system-associated acyl-CoA thioesterase n=1 Tax=hydrothermal vent metagenome TaxID=652676 RepID=A0A3B1CEK2_9ZZZZ